MAKKYANSNRSPLFRSILKAAREHNCDYTYYPTINNGRKIMIRNGSICVIVTYSDDSFHADGVITLTAEGFSVENPVETFVSTYFNVNITDGVVEDSLQEGISDLFEFVESIMNEDKQ